MLIKQRAARFFAVVAIAGGVGALGAVSASADPAPTGDGDGYIDVAPTGDDDGFIDDLTPA